MLVRLGSSTLMEKNGCGGILNKRFPRKMIVRWFGVGVIALIFQFPIYLEP